MLFLNANNTKESPYPAVILGMSLSGLCVIRSLARKGIKTIGMDYDARQPGMRSKYGKKILCAHPIRNAQELSRELAELGRSLPNKSVLYVTADDFLAFALQMREELREWYLFRMPASGLLEKLLVKDGQVEIARNRGIGCPETVKVDSFLLAEEIMDEIKYPAILKPAFSPDWRRSGVTEEKAVLVKTRGEFIEAARYLLRDNDPLLVQTLVAGPITNCVEVNAYIGADGTALGLFMKRKIRQLPIHTGVGSYMESFWDQELAEKSVDFLRNIGYTGFIEIEYKMDAVEHEYKMIEFNPRYVLQTSLASQLGVDFPYIQYADLSGISLQASLPDLKMGRKRWVSLGRDLKAFRELRHGKKPWILVWIRDIMHSHDYAELDIRDPRPFLYKLSRSRNLL